MAAERFHLYLIACVAINIIVTAHPPNEHLLQGMKRQLNLVYKCASDIINSQQRTRNPNAAIFFGSAVRDDIDRVLPYFNVTISIIYYTDKLPSSVYKNAKTTAVVVSPDGPGLSSIMAAFVKAWSNPIIITLNAMTAPTKDGRRLLDVTDVIAQYKKGDVILLAEVNSIYVDIYRVKPFHPLWRPVYINSWQVNSKFDLKEIDLHRKEKISLGGCLFIGCIKHAPPTVVLVKSPVTGELHLQKYGRWLIDTLASHTNFTYEIHSPEDNQFGSVYPNGSSKGCDADIISRKADFNVGDMLPLPERFLSMDFSHSVNYACLTWVSANADFYVNILNILCSGFSVNVWIFLLGNLLVTLLSLSVLAKIPLEEGIMIVFGALLDVPVYRVPRRWPSRLLIVAWSLFSMNMNTIYRSKLLVPLSFPEIDNIDTVAQIAETGYRVSAGPAAWAQMKAKADQLNNPSLYILTNRTSFITNFLEAALEIVRTRKTIALIERKIIKAMVAAGDIPGRVHVASGCFIGTHSVPILYPLGSILKQPVDNALRNLYECGLLQHMMSKYLHDEKPDEFGFRPLGISTVGSIFVILYCGYTLAFIFFLGEVMSVFYKNLIVGKYPVVVKTGTSDQSTDVLLVKI